MGGRINSHLKMAKRCIEEVSGMFGSTSKAIAVATAGAGLVVVNMARSIFDSAIDLKEHAFGEKKKKEMITMKKSTAIALLVALATVAGVLGALYFYVLRREKELDEYEQLLFSEDFTDDLMDDMDDDMDMMSTPLAEDPIV